jgi:hypothetical protein
MRHSDHRSAGRGRQGILGVLTVLLAACAASAGGGGGGGSSSQITREQIGDPTEQTALTIIRRFQPGWLRPRSQGSFTNPEPAYAEVMLDQMHYGGLESLDRISADLIERIEYLDALDATTRYGTNFAGGVIIVHMFRR